MFYKECKEHAEAGDPIVEGPARMRVLVFDEEAADVVFVDSCDVTGPLFLMFEPGEEGIDCVSVIPSCVLG